MKSFRVRMLVVAAVALAALCAGARPASAQNKCQGSFTLPDDVRWGGWTFPAGDYTFTLKSIANPTIILKGPQGPAFVIAVVADQADVSGRSTLTIEHRGGRSFVREMYLAPLGVRLRYSVPKAPKEVEIAQGSVTTEHILIAMK